MWRERCISFRHKHLYESGAAYGIGSHRHMAEIDQELSKYSKSEIKVSFTPHLIPMFRGILSTIYLETKRKNDAKKIYKKLKQFHGFIITEIIDYYCFRLLN